MWENYHQMHAYVEIVTFKQENDLAKWWIKFKTAGQGQRHPKSACNT